jgi:hypothetical protein
MADDESGPGRRYTKEAKKVFACRVPLRDYEAAKVLAKRHRTSVSDIFRASFSVARRLAKDWPNDS